MNQNDPNIDFFDIKCKQKERNMQRIVFDKTAVDGFRTTRVESIAMTNYGHRLFVGTSDGALVVYDYQTSLSCKSFDDMHVFSI